MTSIEQLLHHAVDAAPERVALRRRDEQLTYGALDAAVGRAASSLRTAGAGPGDRVAIVSANVPAAAVLLFATWRVGGVAVPINDRLRADDLAATFAATAPTLVLSVDRSAPLTDIADLNVTRPPASGSAGTATTPPGTALILTTSGSTGTPKPVLVSHQRELDTSASFVERLALGGDDVTVLAVSLAHAFGLSCFLSAIAAAGECVLVDSTTSTAPLVDALADATALHGSPTLFATLGAGSRPVPTNVRTGFVAGASAPAGLLERFDRQGLRLLNLYGMTELGATAATRRDDADGVRWHTSGRALVGHELRVADGELQVRGAHVTAGYFGQPERTARAFTADGWFRTGDLASLDDDGNVTIAGRLDDVVSVAGFTVSPAEIERCLLDHPDVTAAVVVPIPDERLGSRLTAFVIPTGGATVVPRDLVSHVRQRLAGYKVPYRVEFMDDLPRLATGKPDRRALMARASEAPR